MRPDLAGRQPMTVRQHPATRWRLLAAASVAGVVALAGCSGGGGSGTPVSGTITIAAAPGVDDAPLWLAAQHGFFAAAGLHVTIHDFGSQSAELAAVEDGQAQIAASDYGNIFYQETGPSANLKILADAYDASSGTAEILVNPRYANTLTSPADLENVPIGLPEDGVIPFGQQTGTAGEPVSNSISLLAAAATSQARANLIGAADKLDWVPMSQQQEVSELSTGQLKAALLTEPYIYQAESGFGATSVMDVFSGPTATLPMTGYVAKASWVQGNPAAVTDFQAAINRAQAQASMVGPIQQELTGLPGAGITTAAAKMVSIGTYPTVVNPSALGRVELLLFSVGVLSRKAASLPDIPTMIVHG